MKIKKNGKVIRLTESDLQRIVKKVLSEGEILVTTNKEDRQNNRADRQSDREEKRLERKDKKDDSTPEEMEEFLKNGGDVFEDGKKITNSDGTQGYLFRSVLKDGRVQLGWTKGEGLALILNVNDKTYEKYERGGMSDRWNKKDSGSFTFDGKKVTLT